MWEKAEGMRLSIPWDDCDLDGWRSWEGYDLGTRETEDFNFYIETLKMHWDFNGGHSKVRTIFEMFNSREQWV